MSKPLYGYNVILRVHGMNLRWLVLLHKQEPRGKFDPLLLTVLKSYFVINICGFVSLPCVNLIYLTLIMLYSNWCLLHPAFLLALFLDTEDGGYMFLRNVG
jgi:hypothetical protein